MNDRTASDTPAQEDAHRARSSFAQWTPEAQQALIWAVEYLLARDDLDGPAAEAER